MRERASHRLWLRVSLNISAVMLVMFWAKRGVTRQANHDGQRASISSHAAHNSFIFPLSSSISPTTRDSFAHLLPTTLALTRRFSSPIFPFNDPLYQQCLPKLPRRSPPLAARLQRAEKRLLKKRRPARKLLRHQETRKSAIRHERRRTRHTFTKVRLSH